MTTRSIAKVTEARSAATTRMREVLEHQETLKKRHIRECTEVFCAQCQNTCAREPCPICLEPLGRDLTLLNRCEHGGSKPEPGCGTNFHAACIENHIAHGHVRCPVCRINWNEDDAQSEVSVSSEESEGEAEGSEEESEVEEDEVESEAESEVESEAGNEKESADKPCQMFNRNRSKMWPNRPKMCHFA